MSSVSVVKKVVKIKKTNVRESVSKFLTGSAKTSLGANEGLCSRTLNR